MIIQSPKYTVITLFFQQKLTVSKMTLCSVIQYCRLHIITNHSTTYENYRTNDLRKVAFTRYAYIEKMYETVSLITSTEALNQSIGII